MSRLYMVEKPTTEVIEFNATQRLSRTGDAEHPRRFIVESKHASVRQETLFDLFSDQRGMWRLLEDMDKRGLNTVGHLDFKTPAEIFGPTKVPLPQRAKFFGRLKEARCGSLTGDYLIRCQ